MYDAVIIGAGIMGAALARELAPYPLRVLLLEKESDAANGTTKANSAIVHAGYDPAPGTLKARFNALGNPMFDDLCQELGVPFKRTGSLVVAAGPEEEPLLRQILDRGRQNGIPGLSLLSKEEALEREPQLQDHIHGALHASTAGIVDPYLLAIALAENAVENGVEVGLDTAVTGIQCLNPGFLLTLSGGREVHCRYVFNTAGLHADTLHKMVSPPTFVILPDRGQYLLMDQGTGSLVNHIVFPCPTPRGKGVVVLPTVHGNLLVGPNSEDIPNREGLETTAEAHSYLREQSSKYIKGIPFSDTITAFSGLRAKTAGGDFIIGESPTARDFFNAAAIDSPGLTAAPAIALHLRGLLLERTGPLPAKKDFNPIRKNPYRPFLTLPEAEKKVHLQQDPRFGRIICRCESITEGDIVTAIHSPLGARTVDGLKKRVRAGMGRCQSGFCLSRVMELLARELPAPLTAVTKDGGGSFIITRRTKKIAGEPEAPSTPPRLALSPTRPTAHRLAGFPSLRPAPSIPLGALKYDLAVIGGGPAGMAAALEAGKEGVQRILIIERDRELGGILQQCIHNGFGLHIFKEELTGPEYAERFIREVEEAGIHCLLDTTVLDIQHSKRITALSPKQGLLSIEAGAIILAMGCRERTRGAVGIPGTRPAGVFTAGTAQRLVNIEGYMVGQNAIVFGSGDIGLIMARRLTLEGARVAAVVERKPYSEGLTRNLVQCLQDYEIPLLLQHTVTAIHGKERITGVTLSRVDDNKQPLKGTEQHMECDTLLLSRGLIPENELTKKAGITISPLTGGPLVNESMETSLSGVFACGNVAHVHDLADWVTLESQKAGQSAARYLKNPHGEEAPFLTVHPGPGLNYALPQRVRPALLPHDMEFLLRVDGIYREAYLKAESAGKILGKVKKKNLTPGEMVSFTLPAKDLAASGPPGITISLEEGGA